MTDKVVVLGGAGFLGSHIVDALVASGASVVVVDPCVEGTSASPSNLEQVHGKIEWIKKQVEELLPSEWKSLLEETSCLIDCMGLTRHHIGIENPMLDHRLNYVSHLSVIHALKENPVSVIYLGSRGQYGKISGDVDEDAPMNPLDPQGIHKVAAESMYRIYSELYGFGCISLRLGNCYGPRQPVSGGDLGLVGGFMDKLAKQEEVVVFGDETRSRSLVYSGDVSASISLLSQQEFKGFKAINLVGEEVVLQNLLELMVSELGGSYSFAPFPPEIARLDCGTAEIKQDRFKEIAGENFSFSNLRNAISETCSYFKEAKQ